MNTAGFLPAIRQQIEARLSEAQRQSSDASVVGSLAMTLHAYQRYDPAARAYLRAHLLAPNDFDWLYLLAMVRLTQGDFDRAADLFRAALLLRPDDLNSRLHLAESLASVARWDEAVSLYRQLLTRYPDLPQAWYGLGGAQSALNDHNAALRSYTQTCKLFPRYGSAQFALAGELRRQGRLAEAESHFAVYATNLTVQPPLEDSLLARIHELNHSTTSHLQRGAEFEKEGQLAEAIHEEESVLALDPDNVQAHINLISLYAKSGNIAKAKQHFHSAVKLNAGRSDAWYDYGVLLFRQHDYPGAEAAYKHALTLNPYYADAHSNLGIIYEQEGQLADAASEFREAIANRPDNPLPRFHLARILVNQQKYDEAVSNLLRTLDTASDQTPTYLYALGATYARADDFSHARQYLKRAHDLAVAYDQRQLVTAIDRDLEALKSVR